MVIVEFAGTTIFPEIPDPYVTVNDVSSVSSPERILIDLEKKPNKEEFISEETIFDYWRPRQW